MLQEIRDEIVRAVKAKKIENHPGLLIQSKNSAYDESIEVVKETFDKFLENDNQGGKVKDFKRMLATDTNDGLEKVKIPRYVADWIEDNWDNFSEKHKLISMFLSSTKHSKSTQDCYKWSQVKENMDKFMTALVNGYEIEEQLYTVTLENGAKLLKYGENEKPMIINRGYIQDFAIFYLTQTEIESIDPILMGIAKPVEVE